MARNKASQQNIDNSTPSDYPDARIKDNTGSGDGTPVTEATYGDIHEFFAKLMRLYGVSYNGFPDNETNGYQYIEALRGLASKNDFILTINSINSKLSVPVKLSKMLVDEQIVCKVASDLNGESEIVGLEGISRAVTFIGDFKANEYVRLINTNTTIVIVRLVDSVNLETAIDELAYLKAATYNEELAGLISNKATTPLNNSLTFVERVNGNTSDASLAMPSVRNGLFSKEDKQKLDDLVDVADLIQIDSQSSVLVTSQADGDLQDNFNFNYVDVFPPTGKDMSNLKGFMASDARTFGNGDSPDDTWCKWTVLSNKIRVICGDNHGSTPHSINYIAIWI